MRTLYLLILSLCSVWAHADIYKYVDANGVVTYTNVKPDKNVRADLIIATPKVMTVPPPGPSSPSPAKASPNNFPKVERQTQSQRDQKRREILSIELEQERQALESARLHYEEAKNNPEVYRNAQGKTFRNMAKYDEKLRIIEAEIQSHERNIMLLNNELAP